MLTFDSLLSHLLGNFTNGTQEDFTWTQPKGYDFQRQRHRVSKGYNFQVRTIPSAHSVTLPAHHSCPVSLGIPLDLISTPSHVV